MEVLNLFIDNLIVDWVIQKKINHTLYGVKSVHDRVSMILLLLENEITESKRGCEKFEKNENSCWSKTKSDEYLPTGQQTLISYSLIDPYH